VFPKNVATTDVAALAAAAGGLPCVAERVSLYGKEKMLVLYFGRRFVAQADTAGGVGGGSGSAGHGRCTWLESV
jgi:hypothetical protein